MRRELLKELIEEEKNRLTEYYEDTATQEYFPHDFDLMSKNDEERDLQEESWQENNSEV